ncbi:hypothetical protein [Encephalitozoon cuniculi GB-M1]|uniref:Uncharacterized protein n=2 Tax=Encephalitozoon cuniculi TaxID=6035 RepID=Q8SVW6_ENCCU|nr:uncharacterized protein ECU04_0430 [Encephalitozoon cuniculi GB-M1]UYI27418.1 hypothetical protein J0A71_06g12870 [Encephalitozoon cuniculi]CAD25230.2 hypothetical protein [Encephalitozoon cuniculi GB-M1]
MGIGHIVFLSHGDSGKVNQQVVHGRCLVFNPPWDDSPPDTTVQRDGNKLEIESKEIILKVVDRRIVYLETIYQVDSRVEFVELVPSPHPYDFFLSKRHFLSKLSEMPFHPMPKGTVCLRKRRISCFVVPVLLWLLRRAVEYLLVDVPQHAVNYIVSCSAEAKQIITIKTTLGAFIRFFCAIQKAFLRMGHPIVFVGGIYVIPTTVYLGALSRTCSFLASLLIEAVHLLNNSSYNPLRKRRDSVILNTDQIFMSVLIFSFLLLIMFNVVHFHILYISMTLCLTALRMVSDFIDFMLVDTSGCRVYTLSISHNGIPQVVLKYAKVSIWSKVKFATEATLLSSGLSRGKFLLGIK